jgi:hypothetical protein
MIHKIDQSSNLLTRNFTNFFKLDGIGQVGFLMVSLGLAMKNWLPGVKLFSPQQDNTGDGGG